MLAVADCDRICSASAGPEPMHKSRTEPFLFAPEERKNKRAWKDHLCWDVDSWRRIDKIRSGLTSRSVSHAGHFQGQRGFLRVRLLFSNGTAEDFDERRVEGGAGLLFNPFERLFNGNGRATRSIRGEIIKSLGDCHDASQEGDPLFLQSERIARAIPSLVMQGDDLDGFGW